MKTTLVLLVLGVFAVQAADYIAILNEQQYKELKFLDAKTADTFEKITGGRIYRGYYRSSRTSPATGYTEVIWQHAGAGNSIPKLPSGEYAYSEIEKNSAELMNLAKRKYCNLATN